MKTDDLLQMLAADAGPVPSGQPERRLMMAVAVGGAVALFWVSQALGIRAGTMWADPAFWVKLTMPLAVAALALPWVWRLAHPGMRAGGLAGWSAVPVGLLWLWAAVVWLGAPAEQRADLVLGQTWQVCSFNIVVTALPLGVALFWALRGLAPTRPVLAGAVAGWSAGALGAGVYALHCTELAAPFLAVWYVLGMAVCAVLGAVAGARVLRW